MRSRTLALVAKDFLFLWRERSAAATTIGMLVFSPLLASAPGIPTLIMTVFFLSMSSINVFSVDEKYRTERFFASLAVRRRDIVVARYAGTVVVTAVYFVLAFFVNSLELILGNRFVHPIPLGFCAMLLAAVAAVTAISFPFFFKLGIMKARPVTIILYVLPMMTGAVLSGFGWATGYKGSLAVMVSPSPDIFSFNTLTSAAIAAGGLLLWLASIPITVRLYESRDL